MAKSKRVQLAASLIFLLSLPSYAIAHEIWVANQGINKVQVIGVTKQKVIAEISVGKKPHNLAFSPDGKYAYVANVGSNDVSVIETATRKVVATIPAGAKAHGVTFSPDGKFAYIANVGSSNV
ncbi:MAG: YncE family protein, partial [Candidatus Methylomirabilales bacterium]